ncbi:hypothetical protein GCM10010967_09300 [Dyadobacter beijingensis]|uniref:Uncharacterized protein n=1 Tax=Dyadobacter beijingensis TaxID=365489 RepID=A0ABQ2HGW8_9BACT|nr:hypothetical protein GCM10010967_09300 [Dyadobacter beijingensis]
MAASFLLNKPKLLGGYINECKLLLQTKFIIHEKTSSIVTAGDGIPGRARGGAVSERDGALGRDDQRGGDAQQL